MTLLSAGLASLPRQQKQSREEIIDALRHSALRVATSGIIQTVIHILMAAWYGFSASACSSSIRLRRVVLRGSGRSCSAAHPTSNP